MIQQAPPHIGPELTSISFQSKSFWNYPDHYFDIWRDELTITKKYLTANLVYIFQDSFSIKGYYSLVMMQSSFNIKGEILPSGVWLDHMFVLPKYINRGIGSSFCTHLKDMASSNKWKDIHVLADPNATSFYTGQGFQYNKEIPSNICQRTTPWMTLQQ